MDFESSTSKQPYNVRIGTEEEGYETRLNEIAKKFIADCAAEKQRLGVGFPLASILIDEAIEKVLMTGRIPGRDSDADVFRQKPMKVTQKVIVPVKEYPTFNFTGKILGPKGNSLRRLQEETMCKIGIKGRNSIRNPKKEEELLMSGEPRHAHFSKDLHMEISTVAYPAEAYARVAYALAEIRKYLVPDKNDEVSQNQLKEIMADPKYAEKAAIYAEKLAAKNSNKSMNKKPTVSILEKLTGKTIETTGIHQNEDQRYSLNSNSPMRQYSPRPAMKRPPQPSSPQIQRFEYDHKRTRGMVIEDQSYE